MPVLYSGKLSSDRLCALWFDGIVCALWFADTGFMSIAQQTAGRFRAGTAKVEVVASALYGTISGSANLGSFNTGSTATSVSGTVAPGRYFIRMRTRANTNLSAPSSEVIVVVP